MARIVALAPLDTFRVDLNFYDRNFYDHEILNHINLRLGEWNYRDLFAVNGYDYPLDLIFGMLGSNLHLDRDGRLQGNVTAIFEGTYDGTPLWYVGGISVPASTLLLVMATPGNADDRALLHMLLSGNDTARLSHYSDRFEVGAGNDTVWSGGGHDTTFGGAGNDLLRGDAGDDLLFGGSGADGVHGSDGNDRLYGEGGADILDGGFGADTLLAGGGNDIVIGGRGNDLLGGGGSADRFVFSGNFGRDTIRDFDPDQRGERIDLSDVRAITGFRDLRADHLSERGGDAFIDAGGGHTIRLAGVSAGDLSADDFIF